MTVPAVVECPACGRMVSTVRRCLMRHFDVSDGPAVRMSGQSVTDDVLADTRNVERARQIMHWAHQLRDEDPARVHSWIAHTSRAELEVLMCIALAAVNPDQTLSEAFGWAQLEGSR